ncbi:MAG: peptidylprolyl isomerase [Hyphomicrobiaceae bacterium]|nr:MAG: peptidylprolyl isomerase [Hyphomicrobiaceae bacterium]
MHRNAARRRTAVPTLAALVAFTAGIGCSVWPLAAQTPPPKQRAAAQTAKADRPAPAPKGGQAIVVLVNDEPITAYEIEQRASFLAANGGGGPPPDLKAKAEARWAQIIKDPRTNERFQQLLRQKGVKTQQEAQALQIQFVKGLQQEMVEQLRREARATILPQLRKNAKEELIEERVKLQEAKKIGSEIGDEDIKRVLKGLAERNKMTVEQFAEHVKHAGFELATLRERMRAQYAWREVIRRKFGHQVAVTQRDVDRLISSSAVESGEDTVELQLQKITLPPVGSTDQAGLVRRYAEAEALRRKFEGCKSMAGLAKTAANARFDDMKFVKPSSIPEPTRAMLLGAKDGDILPPTTTPGGIEIYAVCSRRVLKGDEKQREKAQDELQQREFDIISKRHLRDLMQEAHIEYR